MREGTTVRVADGRDSMFGSGDSKLLIHPFYRPIAGGADYAAVKRQSPGPRGAYILLQEAETKQTVN